MSIIKTVVALLTQAVRRIAVVFVPASSSVVLDRKNFASKKAYKRAVRRGKHTKKMARREHNMAQKRAKRMAARIEREVLAKMATRMKAEAQMGLLGRTALKVERALADLFV